MTTPTALAGLAGIEAAFATARAEGRATFMPFFTVGFPTIPESVRALETLVEAGADMIEVGMPFSDPLADGPVIQHASQISLSNGTTTADCIAAVRTLREHGVKIPLILMGYVNPLMSYGLERFVEDAAAAGANGFVVPDLPPDEAAEFCGYCVARGMGYIPLLAPNSTAERIRSAASIARGFVYLVSVTGVTGARETLPTDLTDYVRRVRSLTTLPLAIGFGISRPEQAQAIASVADGVIVASALIRLMETEGIEAVCDLAASLRAGCVPV